MESAKELARELAALRAEVREMFAEMRKGNSLPSLPEICSPERTRAELGGISKTKLKTMVACGEIQRCKVGGTFGFPREEILRIKSLLVGPKGAPVVPRGDSQSPRLGGKSAKADVERIRAALRKSKP